MARRIKRIYYGPDGNALSFAGMDNARQFPHPVKLVAFTKSTALVVDKLKKDGSPSHAILYAHSYGRFVERNDDGTLKKLVKDDPEIMERPFTLRPPRKQPPSGRTAGQTPADKKGQSDHARAFVPRGALARAVKAGRIGKNVAEQLSEVAAHST